MPYNTSAIDPSSEISGTTSLPLARVKKIIHADEDIGNCSNNAAFAIAVATELFVRHLTEHSHNIVKSERRPRKNIQYKDVANAVARVDNLEFLADVVPRTITYKAYKEKKAKEDATGNEKDLSNGQRTLHQMRKPKNMDDTTMEDTEVGYERDDEVEESVYEDAKDEVEQQVEDDTDVNEKSYLRSPEGVGAVMARHNFDAVRNEFHDGGVDIPMEE